MYKDAIKLIKKFNKIIIIRHKSPDYDAYGSQLGLYYSLKETFKNKEIYVCGDDNQANIFDKRMDVLETKDYRDALVIVCDTSCLNMLSDNNVLKANKVIVFDHHKNESDLEGLHIIKSEYSSASELIGEFIIKEKLKLNKEASKCLLTGIIGDSNRFLYKGTSINTFNVVSELLKEDIDLINIYDSMKREEGEVEKRFKGFYLPNFKIYNDVAYIYISRSDIEKYKTNTLFASRGCINLLGDLKGIKAFCSFTESEDGKVFFEGRSKKISIVEVAKRIGGGGHELACGATLNKDVNYMDIVKDIDKEVNNEHL